MKLSPSEVRYFARARWSAAKSAGLVPKIEGQFCVDCGADAVDYDHRNYVRYMDVDAVCRSCHVKRGPGNPIMGSGDIEVSWYVGNTPRYSVSVFIDEETQAALDRLVTHSGILPREILRKIIRTEAKRKKVWNV